MKTYTYRHKIFYGGLSDFTTDINKHKNTLYRGMELVGFQVYESSITVPRGYVSAVFRSEDFITEDG